MNAILHLLSIIFIFFVRLSFCHLPNQPKHSLNPLTHIPSLQKLAMHSFLDHIEASSISRHLEQNSLSREWFYECAKQIFIYYHPFCFIDNLIQDENQPIGHILVTQDNDSFIYEKNSSVLMQKRNDETYPIPLRNEENIPNISEEPQALILARDNSAIVMGLKNGYIEIRKKPYTQANQIINAHPFYVSSVALSHNNKILVSASGDGTIKIWDNTKQELIKSLATNYTSTAIALVSSDRIISHGHSNRIDFWHLSTGEHIETIHTQKSISALAVSHNKKYLITGAYDGSLSLWDLALKKIISSYIEHDTPIKDIIFSPNNDQFATSSTRCIKIWQLTTQQSLQTIKTIHSSCAFSADGNHIIVAQNNTLSIYGPNASQLEKLSLEKQVLVLKKTKHKKDISKKLSSRDLALYNNSSDIHELLKNLNLYP